VAGRRAEKPRNNRQTTPIWYRERGGIAAHHSHHGMRSDLSEIEWKNDVARRRNLDAGCRGLWRLGRMRCQGLLWHFSEIKTNLKQPVFYIANLVSGCSIENNKTRYMADLTNFIMGFNLDTVFSSLKRGIRNIEARYSEGLLY
jgi:hypothetical protein